MAWFQRECTWCGVPVAARTDDPDVIVVCLACDPGDLPLSADTDRTECRIDWPDEEFASLVRDISQKLLEQAHAEGRQVEPPEHRQETP